MKINKKAFVRIIEVFIAVLVTFLFTTFIIPKTVTQTEPTQFTFLTALEQSTDFRNCAIGANFGCVNSFVRGYLPDKYDYVFDLSQNPNTVRTGLPQKRIFTESIYFAGNTTNYQPMMVRVYYWER